MEIKTAGDFSIPGGYGFSGFCFGDQLLENRQTA